MISDANGIAISNKLMLSKDNDGSTSFTVYVKEIEPPSGPDGTTIGISDKVVAIQVDPTVNNTRDNPATNPEAIFEDFTQPDKVFLRKVDAITNEPVGPGEYQFENENGAQKFWTNDEGVLELQWWKPGDENYIAPGHYSVTEITPPEGYLGTDEVIAVDLWIEDGKPYSSGPIIFKNYKKFRIELLKVDENNQPLAGTEFKIWKDGEEFSTKTSGPDGMVVLEDLQPGEYILSEVKAPSGKVIPINHVFKFSLREDSEIRVYQAVCVNHDLPELVIKKLEKGTNMPRSGAEFKVTIDGNEVPTGATGDNGTIILTLKNPPSMPAEIRLDKYYQVSSEKGESYGKYHISTLNRNVSHFTCDFDLGSNNITKGFCTQYGLHIGTDLHNAMWKDPVKVTTANYSEDIIRFLDYYAYLQTLHKEVHKIYFPELGECTPAKDEQIINGEVDSPYRDKFTVCKAWTQANLDEIANQAQAFIWAAQEIGPAYKPFSDTYYRTLACKSRCIIQRWPDH